MTKLIAFFLLLISVNSVFAVAPVQTSWWSPGDQKFDTAEAACSATGKPAGLPPTAFIGGPAYVGGTWVCRIIYNGSIYGNVAISSGAGLFCMPGFGAPDTNKPLDKQCPDPEPECEQVSVGSITVTTAYATGPGPGSAIARKIVPDGGLPAGGNSNINWCRNSCVINATGATTDCRISPTPGPNGYFRISCDVPMQQTGQECTAAPPGTPAGPQVTTDPSDEGGEPTAPPPSTGKCPTGSVPSGLDSSGMTICMGSGPPSPAPVPPKTTTTTPVTTTTDASGNSVTSSTSTTTNSDGSKTATTTTVTQSPDGTKATTTTTTTTKPDGTSGGTDDTQKPEDKSDLCKQHPELTICRNSIVGGACKAISCEGDAIQCATLKQAAEMNCRVAENEAALKASASGVLGTAVLSGADPLSASLPTVANGSTVAMATSFDTSGWLGGGACFPDKSFSIQGRTIVVPFNRVCEYLIAFRYVMMIVALLASFKILSGAIIRE